MEQEKCPDYRVSIFQGEVFIGTMGQINCGHIKLIIEMSSFSVCLLCTYVASVTVLRGPQEGSTWWSSTVPAKISGQVSVVKYFCQIAALLALNNPLLHLYHFFINSFSFNSIHFLSPHVQ